MLRIIRDGVVIEAVRHFGQGDSVTLSDGTIIQFWLGSSTEKPDGLMVEGIDYPIGTPTKCQFCNDQLLMSPGNSRHRDIRCFPFLDGTFEYVASCMKEPCYEQFMDRARKLSRDPAVIHP